jgi:anthranilate 1,2-dioxygenase small subunit
MDAGQAALPEATRRLIEDTIFAVARAIDDNRLEAFPDFFSADGVYKVASRFNVDGGFPFAQINCAGHGMIVDRIVSLRNANLFAQHRYRHVISGIHIISRDDGSFHVRSSYLVVRTTEDGYSLLFSSGEYRDRITIDNGRALFRERIVVFDAKGIETALSIPL